MKCTPLYMRLSAAGMFVLLIFLVIAVTYNPVVDSFVDLGGCGPAQRNLNDNGAYAVCRDGLRCINGYCKSDDPPTLPAISPLPIRPDRYTSDSVSNILSS